MLVGLWGRAPPVLLATGSFITVYVIGVAAALRLLPRASRAWYAAAVSLVVVLFLLLMTGVCLLWPVTVTLAALLYLKLRRSPASPVAVDRNQMPVARRDC